MKWDFQAPGNAFQALGRDFQALRRDFQALRRDFQALRRDFQALRRDFQALRKDFQALVKDFRALGKDFPARGRAFRVMKQWTMTKLESDSCQKSRRRMTGNHGFHQRKRPKTPVLNKFDTAAQLLLAWATENASAQKTVTASQVQDAAIPVRNPVQATPLQEVSFAHLPRQPVAGA